MIPATFPYSLTAELTLALLFVQYIGKEGEVKTTLVAIVDLESRNTEGK